tara:strand:+ start:820 stop:1275 length:456 start_codon:yes stop_codon:yes gene_type:complete
MKHLYIATIALAWLTSLTIADDQQAPKGSDYWNQLYDPPVLTPTEIPTTNPLRKALFEQLRPRIESLAKQPILFKGHLKSYRNWAMFMGSALDKSEKEIQFDEFESSAVLALWLRTLDGWKLVDYDGGATDAFFVIWPEQYGTPTELIRSW